MAISTLLDTYLVPSTTAGGSSSGSSQSVPPTSAPLSSMLKKFEKSRKSEFFGILNVDIKWAVVVPMCYLLVQFVLHSTWVTSNAYSSPSIVLASKNPDGSQHSKLSILIAVIDDFREAYYWLRQNTPEKARILSWWDYGYQITGMANRTVLVDNNTWNNTHIATVGKALACSEDVAYTIMRSHDVDYVLVIFGGLLGYSGDDINKFLWMIRIGEGVYPNDVTERSFFTAFGDYKVDEKASKTMKDSLMC
jgi:dolichyl-diphosphooligosaccharide--protein glycosyltransferase